MTVALKGYLLGLSIAIPLGPINVELIRRGLADRPVAGLVVALGATTVDTSCIIIVGFGAHLIAEQKLLLAACYFIGGMLLGWMGLGALRDGIRQWRAHAAPPGADPAAPVLGAQPSRSLWSGYLYGIGVAGTSPYTYVFWTTVPAMFFPGGAPPAGLVLLTGVSVMAGCLSWVLSLTGMVALGRRHVRGRFLAGVSAVGGVAIMGFACLAFFQLSRVLGLLP